MPEIPAEYAAQTALLQQNVALSSIKQAAQEGLQIARLLEQSVQNVPVSSSRGTQLNTTA